MNSREHGRKCKGITLDGTPCKNHPKKGEDYCWRHLEQDFQKIFASIRHLSPEERREILEYLQEAPEVERPTKQELERELIEHFQEVLKEKKSTKAKNAIKAIILAIIANRIDDALKALVEPTTHEGELGQQRAQPTPLPKVIPETPTSIEQSPHPEQAPTPPAQQTTTSSIPSEQTLQQSLEDIKQLLPEEQRRVLKYLQEILDGDNPSEQEVKGKLKGLPPGVREALLAIILAIIATRLDAVLVTLVQRLIREVKLDDQEAQPVPLPEVTPKTPAPPEQRPLPERPPTATPSLPICHYIPGEWPCLDEVRETEPRDDLYKMARRNYHIDGYVDPAYRQAICDANWDFLYNQFNNNILNNKASWGLDPKQRPCNYLVAGNMLIIPVPPRV